MPSVRNPLLLAQSPTLSLLQENVVYRGIPQPLRDTNSLAETAESLKEQMEILTRQRGFIEDSAVIVSEFLTIIDGLTERIEKLEEWVVQLVLAGYGGMYGLDVVVGAVIPATWTTMAFFNVEAPTPARFVTINLPNDSIAFDIEGVWALDITLNVEHDEINASRRFELRIYNLTKAVATPLDWVIGIGRNTDASEFGPSLLVNIPAANVGDQYVLQWQSADTINVVALPAISFTANHVGELGQLA